MPLSPYYGQNGYGTRNYVRSSSSGNLVGMGTTYYSPGDMKGTVTDHPAEYFRAKYIIPEDGPAKSYLTARYSKPPPARSAFQLKRLDSSDNLSERKNPLEENRLKKSTSTSSILTANTPSYLRSSNVGEVIGGTLHYIPKTRAFTSTLPSPTETTSSRVQGNRKLPGRYGEESRYARAYLERINKGREDRPREIDTRDINTSVPRTPKWLKINKSESDAGDISRNRQVVRLTIKREKPSPQDPFTIRNKNIQTIAQKLLEKYQIPEKKPKHPDPKPVGRALYSDSSPPPTERSKETSLAVTSMLSKSISSSTPATPVSAVTQNPLAVQASAAVSEAAQRTSPYIEEDKEDISLVLQRASNTAETKNELESWQEVKDAIYAAVLHPDVDIESDEEINNLIQGEPSNVGAEVHEKMKGKLNEPRRDSMDKGLAIVGQLKRFVKQHESGSSSTKKRSKKLSRGSRKSKKNKEGIIDQESEVKEKEINQAQNTCTSEFSEAFCEKKQEEKVLTNKDSSVGRNEKNTYISNTTSVGEAKGFAESSGHERNKVATEREGSNISASFALGNEAISSYSTTKENVGKDRTELGNSKNLCDDGENYQGTSPSNTKSSGIPSLLSADLVLRYNSHEQKDNVTEVPALSTQIAVLENKQTKTETRPGEPEGNEAPKDGTGAKTTKINKRMKTSEAAMEEVNEDTTRAAHPSGLPLLKLPSPPLSEAILIQNAPREISTMQNRDTHSETRSTCTQGSGFQMESPFIMKKEAECVTAQDSLVSSRRKQVEADTTTKNASADFETTIGGSCLTSLCENEKADTVQNYTPQDAPKKCHATKKLNSSTSDQEEGEKTPAIGKKELKRLKEHKETEIDKAKESTINLTAKPQLLQEEKNDKIKSDPLTKLCKFSNKLMKDEKVVTEVKVDAKQKHELMVASEGDEVTSTAEENETNIIIENEMENQANNKSTGQDTLHIKAAVKKESNRNPTQADSSVQGKNKEGVLNIKRKTNLIMTASGDAGIEGGGPQNTLPMKRNLRKPCQVALPKLPERDTPNEILNARNILKRPVKPGMTTSTDVRKQDAENVTEVKTRRPWKKPVSQSVSSTQGDQCGQVKVVLKTQGQEKEEKCEHNTKCATSDTELIKTEQKITTLKSDGNKSTGEGEGGKDKRGRVLRKQKPPHSRSASSSSREDDRDGIVRKEAEKTKKLTKPISAVKKATSPKGSALTLNKSNTTASLEMHQASTLSTSSTEETKLHKATAQKSYEERQDENEGNVTEERHAPLTSKQELGETGEAVKYDHHETQSSSKEAPEVIENKIREAKAQLRMEGSRESKVEAQKSPKGVEGVKNELVGVSESVDSGYGSSPSTPLPTSIPAAQIKNEEKCKVCGTNCHKKCEKQMPNLCGVNQKLLAEALTSVKKGSTDGTLHSTLTPSKACSTTSMSVSESESTEEETDTSDTDTDFFGLPEIRPPLQTCPKFRKYSVEDFQFIKVLGKGSYGKVMLAKQVDNENYFAVKCLKKDVVLEDNDVECTLIERKVLSLGTKHPYLCHLFCTFQTQSHLFFVMEYLTGGDLMFHIQHCGRFDEFRACFYGAEITSGLKFLHGKGIIYRDLKLDNILLDYQGHIRIADFGMCKLQVYLDRYADTFCGTPDYMAPEVIKGQHYNQCVDWWSFGVLLYEMLTGKSPFKGCDEDHLFWLICNDEPFYPKFLSKEATSILKQLLDKDSSRRLGIPFSPYGEITEHLFFKYIDWNKIEKKEVETPYKPRLRHILDVQYFDPLFTKRQAAITPIDESILATMDQKPFKDFSYTNPNITD